MDTSTGSAEGSLVYHQNIEVLEEINKRKNIYITKRFELFFCGFFSFFFFYKLSYHRFLKQISSSGIREMCRNEEASG